ncbi:MAG: glycoside hydrolase family 27 protein [Janthinobacterium lividum]
MLPLLPRCVLALASTLLATPISRAQTPLADKPPLGWNSWDSYGLSVTEAEWKSNVQWFHEHLQPAGWQYVVLDEGWYLAHPENAESQGGKGDQGYTLDANGEFTPATNRFPEGLAGLATYAHGLGLKFGIHIIRGIPKQAVDGNMPIVGTGGAGGSPLHAADAADTTDLCRWNPDNYGVRNNAAGQAYYDGLMKLYAGWGVDFLKVDCISKPYKTDEIHMIRAAIAKTGRPIVLSLSPGPTPLEQADDVANNAQMWRISDDVWDVWSNAKPEGSFPQTIERQFDVLASWMPSQQPGRWPDADMLPIGTLGPRPGWGKPRESRLTADETRSMLTLWAIARSPLVLGSNLLQMNPSLTAMLTDPEWLAVNQSGTAPRQVFSQNGVIVWRSGAGIAGRGTYLAVFNLTGSALPIDLGWPQLGLKPGDHRLRDVWARQNTGKAGHMALTLPAHGSALYQVD